MPNTKITIKTDITISMNCTNQNACPYCFGSGRVKAMQAYMAYGAGAVRGPDTIVTCSACHGTGIRQGKEV